MSFALFEEGSDVCAYEYAGGVVIRVGEAHRRRPADGQTFLCGSRFEAAKTLIDLASAGYMVPKRAVCALWCGNAAGRDPADSGWHPGG